jgi:hypothetical protein
LFQTKGGLNFTHSSPPEVLTNEDNQSVRRDSLVRHDFGCRLSHDGNAEKGWRGRVLLQHEALLLRKQEVLQKSEPRVLHRRARKRHLLLQEGIVSDARVNRSYISY